MTSIGSFSGSGVMTMARGRNGDIYGVNGLQRGFRWNGVDASVEQLGISPPSSAPTVSSTSGTAKYYIQAVEVIQPGFGYVKEPGVQIANSAGTVDGGGSAKVRAEIENGGVARILVQDRGHGYSTEPSITVEAPSGTAVEGLANVSAVLRPVMRAGIKGKYWCAYRYVDDTPDSAGGPIPSSLSPYAEIELSTPVEQLDWTNISAGSEARVSRIELWRTTADQARVFYRVAVLPSSATTFTDTLSDTDLSSPSRLLPCTAAASTDIVSCTNHGMSDGDEVRFTTITGGSGITAMAPYYVINSTASTFKVSATKGGSAVNITTDMTAGFARCGGFRVMPTTLPNGQPNANRFRVPPQNKSAIVMFQDRAWYAVDAPGRKYDGSSDANYSEPNTLYFSEVDEPESVPEPNELILQDNVNGADRITAIMPFGGSMVVFQERHCYRLSYAAQPVIDANFTLMAQRGCLNQRCWTTHDGVAYVADSSGIYVLDGGSVAPISDGIDTYWTQGLISIQSSANFFMSADPLTRVVRFHFSISAGLPDRALCYHPVTKAWWEEQYGQPIGSAAVVRSGGRQRLLFGAASGGIILADSGGSDITASGTSPIACSLRTSNFSLAPNGQDRSLRILYKPTSSTCSLALKMHYNNSASPRPAAIASDRGSGFSTDASGHATVNLASNRSSLGSATGYAVAMYAGRMDDRSAGGDRHIAVDIAVTRPSGEPVTVYGMAVQGAGQ